MMLTHLFDMGGVSRVLGPVARWEGRLSSRVEYEGGCIQLSQGARKLLEVSIRSACISCQSVESVMKAEEYNHCV